MEKLVSIVLPTYNGDKFLKESIESVLNQTYKNFELIIINDCSTDNTLKIAQSFAADDNRIKVYSNEVNLKLPESLNAGFAKAKGEYFTWTSDDNMFKENAIEYMVNYLENHKNIDMVRCRTDFINEDGSLCTKKMKAMEETPFELWKRCNIGACFMYTREIAEKTGKYSDSLFCAEDYDYWCRLALIGNIAYVGENLYKYRINSGSLSATKWKRAAKTSLSVRLKYFTPFMDKFNIPIEDRINYIVEIYSKNGEPEWLELGRKIDKKLLDKKILPAKLKLFSRQIFSILNKGDDKIVTILGLKLKFKRKK